MWSYAWRRSRFYRAATEPGKKVRGEIEELPSGSYRVRVYAGIDPLSPKRHYLTETVPAGPKAADNAERARTRLLSEVDEKRNARTNATVAQMLDRYMSVLTIEDTTRVGYERMIRLHIRPVLGALPIGRVNGGTVDAFYAQLRRCRVRCDGRPFVEHRTKPGKDEHKCTDACRPHECVPLGKARIRQIHNVLSGAFSRAVKWRWIAVSPMPQAQTPTAPTPDPQPPTAAQAARIVSEAWKDPDWGMFVWLAMTTGARRGELCALRWNRIDDAGVLEIRSSIAQTSGRTWEKDTKSHQKRRIVLDPQTLSLLRAYRSYRAEQAAAVGIATIDDDAFVFSPAPDGSVWPKPDSATQRYARMCRRLGWDMNLHQLRHYSATELITSGVDVRTVAGRLGHGGGGTTTLRVYTAWVSEADQRASTSLGARMPELPAGLSVETSEGTLPAVVAADGSSYRQISTDLLGAIRCGALSKGDPLPTMKDLASRYGVALSTVHRAINILVAEGKAVASRGRRARVL